MSVRKRIVRKLPEFRLPLHKNDQEEQDLKKVKAQMLKELDDNKKKLNEWYDKELDKNLKTP